MSFNSNSMAVTSAVETSPLPEHLYIPQVSINSNTMDVTNPVETSPLPEHLYITQVSSEAVRVAQSSVPFYGLIIVFSFCLVSFRPLYSLSFNLLCTYLVSSNISLIFCFNLYFINFLPNPQFHNAPYLNVSLHIFSSVLTKHLHLLLRLWIIQNGNIPVKIYCKKKRK